MVNITSFSKKIVEFDQIADYLPIVSTITNLANLFLKCLVAPLLSVLNRSTVEKSHYFTYLETKSILKIVTAVIPVLGNILIIIMDNLLADKCLKLARCLDCLESPVTARLSPIPGELLTKTQPYTEMNQIYALHRQLASLGSESSMYELGKMCQDPNKIAHLNIKNAKLLAIKYFRHAAALGHEEAQQELKKMHSPT